MKVPTIKPSEIDFNKYLKDYPEWANVIPAELYADAVIDYFHGDRPADIGLPWSDDFQFRPSELTVWAGYNGSGKSLLTSLIALHLMSHGESCVIASLELLPLLTLSRMTRQAAGTNHPDKDIINRFHEWISGKLWLYDQQGTIDSRRMLALGRYCHEALYHEGQKADVRHLIIDSLMKCGIRVDDYNRQKEFVDQLTAFAKHSGIHVHLVAHSRKGDTEHRELDKADIKGTSEITDLADNVFMFRRNKLKEREYDSNVPDKEILKQSDAVLQCVKQRHGEAEPRIKLWFHKASFQYLGGEYARPIDFMAQDSGTRPDLVEIPDYSEGQFRQSQN